MLGILSHYEEVLRGSYALLMLILSYIVLKHHESKPESRGNKGIDLSRDKGSTRHTIKKRKIESRDGTIYEYPAPRQGRGVLATGLGGFLTGLLGVGIGEVVMPQLVKRNSVPIPVAAATSVFIVIVVVASASFTQITTLIAEGGLNSVPWNVVVYTIPAVIIGGQIGPRLQGKISQRSMEKGIAYLFFVIGVAMAWIAVKNTFF